MKNNSQNLLGFLLEESSRCVFIISKTGQAVYLNSKAQEFVPELKTGDYFTRAVCGKSSPCENCPLCNMESGTDELTGPGCYALCSFAQPVFIKTVWNGEPVFVSVWKASAKDDSAFFIRGLDIPFALKNLGGDYTAFTGIMTSYYRVGEEKLSLIRKLYEQKDWENFKIEVHGLKGTSYSIGAVRLGDFAKKLEFATKDYLADGNEAALEPVHSGIDRLLAEYEKQLLVISSFVPKDDFAGRRKNSFTAEELNKLLKKAADSLAVYELEETADALELLLSADISEDRYKLLQKVKEEISECRYDSAAELLNEIDF